jgi:uroporphyrinogen III methyltransferase/synthase
LTANATRPLEGRTVLVTRPAGQTQRLSAALAEQGARVVEAPSIRIEPPESWAALDHVIERGGYDWAVFTSMNGVRFFWQRLEAVGRGSTWFQGCRVAAIGPETARSLAEHGIRPDLVPDEFVAEALLACIEDATPVWGRRVLLPRADVARDALMEGLKAAGAIVDQVVAYRTLAASPSADLTALLRDGRVDAITFTSSSTVRGFLDGLGRSADLLADVRVACIGPITAATARAFGLHVDVVADVYTAAGLVDALCGHFAGSMRDRR